MTQPVALRLKDIGLTYKGPVPVAALHSCSMEMCHGEYVAITGPSGSGKSTLLNVLGLLDRPSSGIYELNGVDVSSMNERNRRRVRAREIGFVFQSFHLLSGRTCKENVEIGLLYTGKVSPKERRKRAESALESVGMSHRMDSMAQNLSGGEQQRVALARALAKEPTVLLCDEPTGNLDSVNAGAVLDLFGAVHARGATIVVITHDSAVSARADRHLRLFDGVLGEPEA